MKRKTTTDVMQNTNTRQDESKDMKHGVKERKERENYYQEMQINYRVMKKWPQMMEKSFVVVCVW